MKSVYLVVLVLMSFIAFCVYGTDKRRARMKKWRISERVLLGLGIFGGAAGALLGMYVFRHKTKHRYFWLVNITALILQCILLFFLI